MSELIEIEKAAKKILKEKFGYDNFRQPQDKIVTKLINGENISLIMPTGGGKSLCYQIPSLIREGIGVIISPLIALMENQVKALKANGINALYINSTLSTDEKRKYVEEIESGKVDLLYVSPELLLSERFYDWVKKLHSTIKIALFAVDESHCVSQWGHDFRKEYTGLYVLAHDFPDVPRIALTATANELTRNEILHNLSIEEKNQFIAGFDRPNISYHINEKTEDEKEDLFDYINQNHRGKTGIVYCLSRKRTEDFASFLRAMGLNAVHYHARLEIQEKKDILDRFLEEDDIIVVATIAFGMGIDKPNVRFVCHMDLPQSIESYYQETGRAGRDGLPSVACMFYGISDVFSRERLLEESKADEIHKRIERNNLESMFTLCEVSNCRRQVLVGYFDDELKEPCGNCDNCLNPPQKIDGTIIAQKFLSAVWKTRQRFGSKHLINVLRGEKDKKIDYHKHNELSVYGIGKDLKATEWQSVIRQLIVLRYVKVNPEYNTLYITDKGVRVLKENEKVELNKKIFNKKVSYYSSKETIKDNFTLEENRLFNLLKQKRYQISTKWKVPAYVVFNDETLIDMVVRKPKTMSSFLSVNGVSLDKSRKIGEDFVNIIKEYS